MSDESKETDQKSSSGNQHGQIYFINGVRVPFPAKAYPSQITMMHKILRGIDRKQNCLLESPTGSGKTLALLCSSLAWQKNEKGEQKVGKSSQKQDEVAEQSKYFDRSSKEQNFQDITKPDFNYKINPPVPQQSVTVIASNQRDTAPSKISPKDASDGNGEDDLDFQSAKKRFRTPSGGAPSAKKPKNSETTADSVSDLEIKDPPCLPTWKMELNIDTKVDAEVEANVEDEKLKNVRKKIDDEDIIPKEKQRVPRIYFGTRTHKQIAQIVRELKKTAFKTCRMTILSSREHSCVHPTISKGKDKNEECRRHVKGIDGKSCRYHSNTSNFCQPHILERFKLNESWDIEDLVTAGKKAGACPYYAARELMEQADIIFCPYNYLVDPHIRSQMAINITDEIVVLDEAHNIEDSAREAASITVTSTQLEETMEELNKLIYFRVMPESHQAMHTLCSIIHQWLESLSGSLTRTGFETAAKILTGEDMVLRLEMIQITASTFPVYKENYSEITTAEFDQQYITNIDAPKLTSKATTVLFGLITAFEKVLGERHKFSSDFRIAVSRKASTAKRIYDMGGGWKTSRNQASSKSWEYSLNFWCLNPAVVFSEIGKAVRCIVLTSGTLSPMKSFASELGVSFPIQLEANHVIQDSQAWVGALTVGPDNQNIIANYQSSETFSFQDGVGKIILRICEIVPYGVLCFFASYSLLEKLKKRWVSTGLWRNICKKKAIFSEPRGSDRFALDEIMQEFYDSCEVSGNDEGCTNGALLLAVCRGKISEGLDFSDNNARAVITIGIPFPDFKDTQVELKRKYNNDHCASRGLLNGSEWYEIQAYRALNQALGRCIRHRKDWGAILLVDERFGRSPKYKNGLSKWVRGRCKLFNDFHECISSVAAFAEARKLEPCPELNVTLQTPNINPAIAPMSCSATSYKDTKNTCTIVTPDGLGTPLCQDKEMTCTIVRQDGFETPQVKGQQNEPRNLNSQFKFEEKASFQPSISGQHAFKSAIESIKTENTSVVCSTASVGDHGDSSDSVPGRKYDQGSWKNSVVIGSNEGKYERRNKEGSEKLCCNAKIPPDQTFKMEKPRYNSFENLLKPVIDSSQAINTNESENLQHGRVKLFKTMNLCSVEAGLKQENSSSDESRLDNAKLFSMETDETMMNLKIDAMVQNLTDEAEMIACSVDDIQVRESSPNLFSNPSPVMEDSDANAAKKKTGNQSRLNDVIDQKIEDGWDDGFQIPDELDAVELNIQKGKDSLRNNNAMVKAKDLKDTFKISKRKSKKKEIGDGENVRKVDEKLDDKGSSNRDNLYETFKTPDRNETPKVSRKRASSRKQSNLRMSSSKKKLGATVEHASEEVEMPTTSCQSTVSCLYCNSEFAKTDDLHSSEVKSSTLSGRFGSSSKGIKIFEFSLENITNFRRNIGLHDCQCKTSGLDLNSILSDDESLVFVPLFCETCHKKRKPRISLIGFKIIRIASPSEKMESCGSDDVWLLADKVTIAK